MEMVIITLKIPKAIVDFLQSVQVDIEGYFVVSIVSIVEADLEDWLFSRHALGKDFNLQQVFCEYGRFQHPFQARQKINGKT